MALVTYTGPTATTGRGGFTFYRGEPRQIPDDVAAAWPDHAWFTVELSEEKPKRRRKEG